MKDLVKERRARLICLPDNKDIKRLICPDCAGIPSLSWSIVRLRQSLGIKECTCSDHIERLRATVNKPRKQ